MDSRTQTTTEPSVPDTTSSGKRTVPTTNVDSGHKISPGKLFDENGRLPEPKSAPKEVEEPEDPQTLVDRMASDEETTENQKQWEAYNESEWGTYVAQKAEIESITPEGFLKPGEAEEDEHPTRQILANMSFRNGHEVNAHLLMQLEKSVVSQYPGLRNEWNFNVTRMKEWAESDYAGDFEPVFLDEKGNVIKNEHGQDAHSPPNIVDDNWSKANHRKEAPPKQSKVTRLPQSKSMDNIRAEIGELLRKVAQDPELIRGECGHRFGILNETITKLSAEYRTKFNSQVKTEDEKISLIDQRVPDLRIMQMIVEFVEQMVATGEDGLGTIEKVMTEYELLEKTLDRAGHPPEWFGLIETTVRQKVKLARNFNKEQPGRDYHEHANLWKPDLGGWLIHMVDSSGHYSPRRTMGDQTGPKRPALDQQSQTPERSEASNKDSMEGLTSHGALAGQQSRAEGAIGASGETTRIEKDGSDLFADAVKINCDPTCVLDGKKTRKIEGYVKAGRGHSLLIRMNDPKAVPAMCELTAAGPFGSALNKYRTLSNARHIQPQTDLEHLKTKSITDLHCTFIATQRGTCSRTIIGGRFEGDGSHIERQYFQSQLDRAMGKASVNGWIKQIWPEMLEVIEDDAESAVSSGDEPLASSTLGTTPTQHGAPGKRRPTHYKQKGATMALKQPKRRDGNETYGSKPPKVIDGASDRTRQIWTGEETKTSGKPSASNTIEVPGNVYSVLSDTDDDYGYILSNKSRNKSHEDGKKDSVQAKWNRDMDNKVASLTENMNSMKAMLEVLLKQSSEGKEN
ncbi:hypothetical protein KC331_g615 [Hortaea werneckii]|nr:hypothetical protein KC331_g615 [Hortaea werneckii]